jgi:thioredoxin reductase (NADPH)
VILLVRGDSLEKHMSDYLVREIRNRPNVEVRLRTEAVEGHGDGQLERLTIADRERGLVETRPASALFVLIGAQPHTEWLADEVQRDAKGFIVTGTDVNTEAVDWPLDRPPTRFETSMPGVFAAGDVRSGSAKRVGSAVGEGAVAMPFIHEYLKAPVSLGAGVASGRAASRRSHEDRRPGRSLDRATDSV